MTTPYERTRSTLLTREFLGQLADGRWSVTPEVQNQARRLLRHYPETWHVERAHESVPDWWGPIEDPMQPKLSASPEVTFSPAGQEAMSEELRASFRAALARWRD